MCLTPSTKQALGEAFREVRNTASERKGLKVETILENFSDLRFDMQ